MTPILPFKDADRLTFALSPGGKALEKVLAEPVQ
jgi:hypothetical protein